jgi:RNA polymerase sigma-70 factor (ECF subfamily)
MRQAAIDREDLAVEHAGGFEAFFEAQHARLYGTLCLVTADAAEAEDVMQEAFLKVWERWDRVGEHPNPPGYLYRTAFNLYRSRLRRAMRAARRVFVESEQPDAFLAVEERHALFAALKRLPRRQRTAVVLLDLMGFTSDEAGHLLGVRPVTARVLASQARAAVRRAEGDLDA